VGEVVIDKSGKCDFGDLPPGEYELTVTYPGEDAVGFGFVIDPYASSSDVLIDVSGLLLQLLWLEFRAALTRCGPLHEWHTIANS
jgi:hypothetical protein